MRVNLFRRQIFKRSHRAIGVIGDQNIDMTERVEGRAYDLLRCIRIPKVGGEVFDAASGLTQFGEDVFDAAFVGAPRLCRVEG